MPFDLTQKEKTHLRAHCVSLISSPGHSVDSFCTLPIRNSNITSWFPIQETTINWDEGRNIGKKRKVLIHCSIISSPHRHTIPQTFLKPRHSFTARQKHILGQTFGMQTVQPVGSCTQRVTGCEKPVATFTFCMGYAVNDQSRAVAPVTQASHLLDCTSNKYHQPKSTQYLCPFWHIQVQQ